MRKYIEKFITAVMPDRTGLTIEDKHPSLETWKAWYKGKTDRHKVESIKQGQVVNKLMLSSGFAKLVCETWASSFMNEELKINVGDEKQQAIIDTILDLNGFKGKINKFTEKYFALGMGAIVVTPKNFSTSDDEVVIQGNEELKISLLDAERINPITIEDDEVTELAIIRLSTNACTIQLHLLNKENNYVVYECEGKKNGEGYNFYFDEENISKWDSKQSNPLFSIWYPQVVDNQYLDNPLGTSIFADCEDELYSFDLIFDRFNTEFKNGAKKRFISSDLTYINNEGEEVRVPLGDEDVYLPSSKIEAAGNVQEYSTELRTGSFIQGLNFYANLIGKKCGLGDDAFSFDTQGGRPLQTATAEILKKQDAMVNVRKNENYATIQLKRMCMAIKQVYNTFIDNSLTYEINDVKVVFADNIVEDTDTQRKSDAELVTKGLMTPVEFRVKWFNKSVEEAEKDIYTNGILFDKYLMALQSKAITPELFVERVYGNTIDQKTKTALIENMKVTPAITETYEVE